jgi:ribonuclease VapC
MSGRQPASDRVNNFLLEAEPGHARLFMSAIKIGEIYYFLKKHHNDTLAESWRESSRTLPTTIEVPRNEEIWDAASLKGHFPISYADAFAAALAQKYNCPLVTGDPELKLVSQLELDWLGED